MGLLSKSSVLLALTCLIVNAVSPLTLWARDSIQGSVVKLLVTQRMPDALRPYMKASPKEVSGSGVVIEGGRVLTNAHLVAYASNIYVQPYQSADKITARIAAVAPGVDLAVLELDEPSFFDAHPAMPLDEELPKVKDTVNVYGYPVGGIEQSITEGIVSRIEYAQINMDTSILRIQIDAALNPGNSGGPAVIGDKIVGLVFQTLNLSSGANTKRAENIGYLIPVEEIEMFLDDIADGTYEGKPLIQGIHFQLCENKTLRSWLGFADDVTGVLVSRVQSGNHDFPLQPWDLITHIGSYPIDSEGQIRVHDDLRLPAFYKVSHLAEEGTVPLTVLREGAAERLRVPVETKSRRLISYEKNRYPSYFIYGPMVFTPVSGALLSALSRQRQWQYPFFYGSPVAARYTDLVAFGGEELVALVPPMFPHRITKGYNPMITYGVVSHVGDIAISNLRHLVQALREAKGEHITIRLANVGNGIRRGNVESGTIVFRRKELESATLEILDDNGIRYQFSEDLREAWEGAASGTPGS